LRAVTKVLQIKEQSPITDLKKVVFANIANIVSTKIGRDCQYFWQERCQNF
jgi:hypothetical protein